MCIHSFVHPSIHPFVIYMRIYLSTDLPAQPPPLNRQDLDSFEWPGLGRSCRFCSLYWRKHHFEGARGSKSEQWNQHCNHDNLLSTQWSTVWTCLLEATCLVGALVFDLCNMWRLMTYEQAEEKGNMTYPPTLRTQEQIVNWPKNAAVLKSTCMSPGSSTSCLGWYCLVAGELDLMWIWGKKKDQYIFHQFSWYLCCETVLKAFHRPGAKRSCVERRQVLWCNTHQFRTDVLLFVHKSCWDLNISQLLSKLSKNWIATCSNVFSYVANECSLHIFAAMCQSSFC